MSDEQAAEVSTKPRVRVNAKQTSKGEWYFDVTAETQDGSDAVDLLLATVNDAESKFSAAGKVLAGV